MREEETKLNERSAAKTDKIALLSLTLLFLSIPGKFLLGESCVLYRTINTYIFLFTLMLAIALAVVAVFRVKKSKGKLKGERLSYTVVAIGLFVLVFMLVILPRVRCIAYRMRCGTNMSALRRAILMYANDNDGKFPSADNWCDLLIEHGSVDEEQFKCRDSFLPVFSYGFNRNLDGLRIEDVPPDTVVLFEIDGGRNISGGPELMVDKKHDNSGSNILFADFQIAFGSKKHTKELKWGVPLNLQETKKDPNDYYDGCVSCTLTVDKKGILSKVIVIKTTFKNETDYPIPIEDRHIIEDLGFDVSLDGEPVQYLGALASRFPSEFPWDYYILPPRATYVNSTNLSIYYDLSKKGKYSVKHWAFNCIPEGCFVIESEPIEFEIKYWMKDEIYSITALAGLLICLVISLAGSKGTHNKKLGLKRNRKMTVLCLTISLLSMGLLYVGNEAKILILYDLIVHFNPTRSPGGQMYWIKCRNAECKNEWLMDRIDYFVYLRENQDPMSMVTPAVLCTKCGEKGGYRAEKCEMCGLIFERGSVPNDFVDRCPNCSCSKTEERRKAFRGR